MEYNTKIINGREVKLMYHSKEELEEIEKQREELHKELHKERIKMEEQK